MTIKLSWKALRGILNDKYYAGTQHQALLNELRDRSSKMLPVGTDTDFYLQHNFIVLYFAANLYIKFFTNSQFLKNAFKLPKPCANQYSYAAQALALIKSEASAEDNIIINETTVRDAIISNVKAFAVAENRSLAKRTECRRDVNRFFDKNNKDVIFETHLRKSLRSHKGQFDVFDSLKTIKAEYCSGIRFIALVRKSKHKHVQLVEKLVELGDDILSSYGVHKDLVLPSLYLYLKNNTHSKKLINTVAGHLLVQFNEKNILTLPENLDAHYLHQKLQLNTITVSQLSEQLKVMTAIFGSFDHRQFENKNLELLRQHHQLKEVEPTKYTEFPR